MSQLGFADPKTIGDVWSSTLQFINIKANLAIEINFDWRDIVLSVMILRLIDGKCPQGYYVDGGKRCRIYLQEMIRRHEWTVPDGSLKCIMPPINRKKPVIPTAVDIENRLEAYKDVLGACIENNIQNH